MTDDEETRRRLYELRLSDGQIARLLGIKATTFGAWRARRDLPANRTNEATLVGEAHEAALILWRAGWSDARIGAAFSMGSNPVAKWRARNGLDPHHKPKVVGRDRMMELYRAGENDNAIARALGCNQSGVTRWRARYGLPPNVEVKRISPELHETLRKLLLAKMSARELERVFCVPLKWVQNVRASIGPDPRLLRNGERPASAKRPRFESGRIVPNLPKAKRRAAFEAWARGCSDEEIAREVGGADRSRIVNWRRCYGLPNNKALAVPRPKPRPLGEPIRANRNALYARIAAAIGDKFSPDIAADAISDVVVAVLSGELPEDRIEAEAPRYARRVLSTFASSFGPRSLDEEIGEDGFTLADVIPDPTTSFLFDVALYRGLEHRRAAA